MLERGIPLNEIETSDIIFYLDYLKYRQEKEELKAEKAMDDMGL